MSMSGSRTRDELPQSAAGKTIMTTEPKFIPKEAATVQISEDVEMKLRMIDCVGFLVPGSEGHIEDGAERMVKTPWMEAEIPFSEAAEIGTRKVITEHATVGIVVTCDGSFGDIPRANYIEAEERTVEELKEPWEAFSDSAELGKASTAEPVISEAAATAGEIRRGSAAGELPAA